MLILTNGSLGLIGLGIGLATLVSYTVARDHLYIEQVVKSTLGVLLRGTIVNRTYGIHTNLYI